SAEDPILRFNLKYVCCNLNEFLAGWWIRRRRDTPRSVPCRIRFRQQCQTFPGIRGKGPGMSHHVVDEPRSLRALGEFVEDQSIGDAGLHARAIEIRRASNQSG